MQFSRSWWGTVGMALVLAMPVAHAQSILKSQSGGSELSLLASVVGVAGLSEMKDSGQYLVASVEVVGDAAQVSLRRVGDGATVVLRLSGQAAQGSSLAVGQTLTASTDASGTLLLRDGKALAFVPAAATSHFLYHARHGA